MKHGFLIASLGIFVFTALVSGLIVSPRIACAGPACTPGVPCLSYTPGGGANDDKTDSTTCDGDFMNQIYARAWMEAQRENVINQTYIRKPDSVLEYACFDRLAGMASRVAAPMFSSSNRWQMQTVPLYHAYVAGGQVPMTMLNVSMGPNHMDAPLRNVVLQTTQTYINNNFDHSFLGGAVGANYTPSLTIASTYNCNQMNAIWHIAQCENLPMDAFPTFQELISADPRQLPTACPGTTITAQHITIADNAGPAYPAAEFDPVVTNFAYYIADNTTLHTACSAPIDTGLRMTYHSFGTAAPTATNPSGLTRTSNVYPEKICPNLGCYYNAASDTCVTP